MGTSTSRPPFGGTPENSIELQSVSITPGMDTCTGTEAASVPHHSGIITEFLVAKRRDSYDVSVAITFVLGVG